MKLKPKDVVSPPPKEGWAVVIRSPKDVKVDKHVLTPFLGRNVSLDKEVELGENQLVVIWHGNDKFVLGRCHDGKFEQVANETHPGLDQCFISGNPKEWAEMAQQDPKIAIAIRALFEMGKNPPAPTETREEQEEEVDLFK